MIGPGRDAFGEATGKPANRQGEVHLHGCSLIGETALTSGRPARTAFFDITPVWAKGRLIDAHPTFGLLLDRGVT